MITPELVTYIKEQLAQGIAEGALKDKLVANGWKPMDVDEGLRVAKPAPVAAPAQAPAPVQSPVQSSPVQSAPAQTYTAPQASAPAAVSPLASIFSKVTQEPVQSSPVQSAPVTTPVAAKPVAPVQPQQTSQFSFSTGTNAVPAEPVAKTSEPVQATSASRVLLLAGVVGILLGTLLSVLSFSKILAGMGSVTVALGAVAAMFLVISLIQVALIHAFTKLFKLPLASWKRAFFVIGVPTALSGFASLAGTGSSILPLILGLIVIVIWFVIFMKTYKSGFGKALGVGLLTIVITIVLAGIASFALGLGAVFKIGKSIQNETQGMLNEQTLGGFQEIHNDVIFNDVTTIGANCVGNDPAIDITAPLSGTFKVGQDMTITWKSCNVSSTEEVLVSMVRPDGSDFAVYVGMNSGSATFAPIYPGSFKVRLSDNDSDSDKDFMDTTDAPITVVQ